MSEKKKKREPMPEEPVKKEPEAEEKPDERDVALENLKKELADSSDKFLRLAADFENYKKRMTAEKMSLRSVVVSDTVQMMLPILDNLQRALDAAKEDSPLKEGVSMTLVQAQDSFEKFGITSFGERGEDFDPEIHNAVMTTDDAELESGKIAMVLQRGYRIGDKIIRHALVGVTN